MIQRSLWKRPALQTSEAVLLPALPRMKAEFHLIQSILFIR